MAVWVWQKLMVPYGIWGFRQNSIGCGGESLCALEAAREQPHLLCHTPGLQQCWSTLMRVCPKMGERPTPILSKAHKSSNKIKHLVPFPILIRGTSGLGLQDKASGWILHDSPKVNLKQLQDRSWSNWARHKAAVSGSPSYPVASTLPFFGRLTSGRGRWSLEVLLQDPWIMSIILSIWDHDIHVHGIWMTFYLGLKRKFSADVGTFPPLRHWTLRFLPYDPQQLVFYELYSIGVRGPESVCHPI